MISFWCKECRKDFDAPGEMTDNGLAKFFKGKCPKSHRAIRYITDRHLDPYFLESEKMKAHRAFYRKDLIQPGEAGFKTLYAEEWKRIEAAKEAHEQKRIAWEKEREKVYTQYIGADKKTIMKVLDKEEEMSYGTK